VEPVLGGEVRDRTLGGRDRVAARAPDVRLDALLERGGAAQQVSVLGRRGQPVGGGLLQQAHRVLGYSIPAFGIDRAEDLGPVRIPGPAVVVGESGEDAQRLGEAGRERLRGSLQIASASLHVAQHRHWGLSSRPPQPISCNESGVRGSPKPAAPWPERRIHYENPVPSLPSAVAERARRRAGRLPPLRRSPRQHATLGRDAGRPRWSPGASKLLATASGRSLRAPGWRSRCRRS
jgi:hypothetical protein